MYIRIAITFYQTESTIKDSLHSHWNEINVVLHYM